MTVGGARQRRRAGLGQTGLSPARPDRADQGRLVSRRRRAVPQRLLRQQRANRRTSGGSPTATASASARPRWSTGPRCGADRIHVGVNTTAPSVVLSETRRKILLALARPVALSAFATPATNQEIADEVSLSVDAVKAHLRGLFEQFGLPTCLRTRSERPLRQPSPQRGPGAARVLTGRAGSPRCPFLIRRGSRCRRSDRRGGFPALPCAGSLPVWRLPSSGPGKPCRAGGIQPSVSGLP